MPGIDAAAVLAAETSRLPWYSRSVDSTYLTGKRVFVFGDATHAVAAARVAAEELASRSSGLGTYSREFAREVREAAKRYGVEALITDDYLEVEAKVAELQPELVLGTQMERHIAKRLGIPCAVISAPVHVQDFPARYSPQMGFEGANVLFDTWVHPLMMGLEEHLLAMFREDFEFHDGAGAFASRRAARRRAASAPPPAAAGRAGTPAGRAEAEKELGKIPFFVRGKARRNTERFAARTRPRHASPWRRCTMPKPISAADRDARARRRRDDGQSSGGRDGARRSRARARAAGPRLAMHAAAEWGSDPAALARCHADIARGRHRHRDDAVHRGAHPRGAAGAARPAATHCDAMVVLPVGRRGRAS